MIPTVAPNIIRDVTNGIIISSPSIKDLLFIISTVSGLAPFNCKPGAVGSLNNYNREITGNDVMSFTLVNNVAIKIIKNLFIIGYRYMKITISMAGLGPGPANTSGKYPGNALPVLGENACQVFCPPLGRGKALRERYPTSWLDLHWLTFPVALSCKAQIVTSYLQ